MVRKVVFSARSRSDLKTICDHVADADPDAALQLGRDLLDRIDGLAEFPRLGRRYCFSPEGEVHVFPCRGYRIFYRLSELELNIVVMHIRHGARDEPDFPG